MGPPRRVACRSHYRGSEEGSCTVRRAAGFRPIVGGPLEEGNSRSGLAGREGSQEEDFLRSAIIGITRKNQKWAYDSVEGNEDTIFAACAASVLPPKRIVGSNELFPEWRQIKATYPDAEDAFSSPSHDLLLVAGNSHLIIVPVYDGKIGKPLADIDLFDQPVMVQWAIGKYLIA